MVHLPPLVQVLDDLAAGRETTDSLAVSLAAPRLRREAVPLPGMRFPDADRRLYRLLEEAHGVLAHARYLAHQQQIASFADACHLGGTLGQQAPSTDTASWRGGRPVRIRAGRRPH